jgi:hypothetical protein
MSELHPSKCPKNGRLGWLSSSHIEQKSSLANPKVCEVVARKLPLLAWDCTAFSEKNLRNKDITWHAIEHYGGKLSKKSLPILLWRFARQTEICSGPLNVLQEVTVSLGVGERRFCKCWEARSEDGVFAGHAATFILFAELKPFFTQKLASPALTVWERRKSDCSQNRST